jgi:hypothetical protein
MFSATPTAIRSPTMMVSSVADAFDDRRQATR